MSVIAGVDPHKASHTAVAIDTSEEEQARKKIRAGRSQVDQLMTWAERSRAEPGQSSPRAGSATCSPSSW
jgi:hypothetical protein